MSGLPTSKCPLPQFGSIWDIEWFMHIPILGTGPKTACSLENVQGSKATPNLIQIHIIGTLNPTKSPSFHLPSAPSSSFALCTGSHDSIRSRLIDRNICYVSLASLCKLLQVVEFQAEKEKRNKGDRNMKCKAKCKIIENPKHCSKISD